MSDRKPIRVRMGEADFRALVSGEVVTLLGAGGDRVDIILADVGWNRMLCVISEERLKKGYFRTEDWD